MAKLMPILFAVLAVLFVVMLIDRNRQVEQFGQMRDTIKETETKIGRISDAQAKLDQITGLKDQVAALTRTSEKLAADLGARSGEAQASLGAVKGGVEQLNTAMQVLAKQQAELRGAVGDSAALARSLDSLQADLGKLHTNVSGLSGNLTTIAGNVSGLQGNLTTLQGNVGALGQKVDAAGKAPLAPANPPDDPANPARDGNPKLDVNFLLPVDRSTFSPAKAGGTIRSFTSTTKSLNPLTDQSATTGNVHAQCNDSLCERPPRSPEQWQESLAESVVISDDFKTYTFNLRKGVLWQRPPCAKQPAQAWLDKDVELTADDFKFTLDLIMNPDVDCPSQRAYWEEDFARAEVVDRYTLRLHWKNKVYTSLSSSLSVSPMPRHIYARNADGSEVPAAQLGVNFNKHWFDQLFQVVGVGAYQLESYEKDQKAVFRRNPAYWGVPLHFERQEWILSVKKDDAQLIGFKNGDVHSYGLSPRHYKSEILDHKELRFAVLDPGKPKAGRSGELGWERVKAMSFGYLGWNMRRALFRDRAVRQAMTHAFDKERIIRDVFYGLGQPVCSDVHPDMAYCNKDLVPYAYSLDKAKALLDGAGWKDSDGDGLRDQLIDGKRVAFAFTIKYYADSPEWDNTLLIYRNALKSIGIDMKPLPLEWKELMRVYEDKDFEAMVGGWQMDWDIDYYQLWHSQYAEQQGSSNHCGFADKRMDALALKLRQTFETPARIAIAKDIQAILHDQQPYTFFRAAEGIFVWQNQAPGNVAPTRERYLDGVVTGLDAFHPLQNRTRSYWHFRN